MVIIGVLVAIAVPVYLNYRKGAADKSAQSDVRGAISAIEQYYTDNGNTYPATLTAVQTSSFTLAGTTTGRVTLSDETRMMYVLASAQSYRVCATNAGGSKVYRYDSLAGGSVNEATSPAITPPLTTANCTAATP